MLALNLCERVIVKIKIMNIYTLLCALACANKLKNYKKHYFCNAEK